jgi:hypothetical protein
MVVNMSGTFSGLGRRFLMRAKYAFVATAWIAMVGCGGRGDNAVITPDDRKPKVLVGRVADPSKLPSGLIHAPDRPGDAPDRVNRKPEVSDDAREIAQVRKQFEQQVDALYAVALERVKKGEMPFSEHLWALEQRKQRAVGELEQVLTSGQTTPDAGLARTAHTLIVLGDPEGERFLIECLRSRRPSSRKAALEMLREWDIRPDFGDPERAGLALSLIDDPDPEVAEAAVQLCAFRKIPGTEARLVALLQSGRARDPRSVARELAEVAESAEGIRVMLAFLLKDRPKRHEQWTGWRLERLIKSPDPKVAEPVRTAFRDFMLGYTGQDRYDQSVVHDLAMVADTGMVPILEDIAARARDPVATLYAKQALARLRPDAAVKRLLQFIRPEGPYDMEVDALREFAAEKDADRIIAALLGDPRERRRRVISLSVTRLFLERLGARGRRTIQENMDGLEPQARMWALWKLKGLTLSTALDDLHAAGVVAVASGPLLERMRQDQGFLDDHGPLDMSDPNTLIGAFSHAGILTTFDVETDELPCDHDRLILRFAENSRGEFTAECPVQAWHRKSEDDFDGPYTVRFLYKGRLYRFGAENRGDWYDVEAVQRALNFALEQAGQRERFLALESDGQIASFVFANPEVFLPLADKYGLPLSADANEAMRKGKEFEQKVFEQRRE